MRELGHEENMEPGHEEHMEAGLSVFSRIQHHPWYAVQITDYWGLLII